VLRQAFGGDDRARLQSKQQLGHTIGVGTDVLFTVKGCVSAAAAAALPLPAWQLVRTARLLTTHRMRAAQHSRVVRAAQLVGRAA
jgi:hypothetical protein